MSTLDLITPGNIGIAALAFSAASFGWLTLRGWSPFTQQAQNAVQAVRSANSGARPRRTFDPSSFDSPEVRAAGSLRLPLSSRIDGPDDPHPEIGGAFQVLRSALDVPDRPCANSASRMAAARSGDIQPRIPPARSTRASEESLERLLSDHAWWETVLLELMDRNRAAGTWLAPIHLDPFLRDRPDIAAALRAGRDGIVEPEGAAIVAHWQAEKVSRCAIREPRIAPAVTALGTAAP